MGIFGTVVTVLITLIVVAIILGGGYWFLVHLGDDR